MAKDKPRLPKENSSREPFFPIKTYLYIFVILSLVPIGFFVWKFWDHEWSSQPGDWGVFGDYFGGIFNPIIALLTLIVTIQVALRLNAIEKRNHEENLHGQVKPLISIQSAVFYSADTSAIHLSLHSDFYSYEEPTQPITPYTYLQQEPFYLKVANYGLGVAKDVEFEFEIDLMECKAAIELHHERLNLSMSDPAKDKETSQNTSLISFDLEERETGSAIIKTPLRKFPGIVKNNSDKTIPVAIPSEIMTAFQLFNLKGKITHHDKVFPIIHITGRYKNIHDRETEVKFKLGLYSIHDFGRYSAYRLLVEEIPGT